MFMRLDNNDTQYGTADLSEIEFESYDSVIVSDYNKGYLSESDIQMISQRSKLSFLDSKKRLGPWAEDFTFIKINNFEYEETKSTITNKIASKLIVTRGPRGCEFQGRLYNVEPVDVKDTSGAGDTFVAALCYSYNNTSDIRKAILYANHCSTKVVQKKGIVVV